MQFNIKLWEGNLTKCATLMQMMISDSRLMQCNESECSVTKRGINSLIIYVAPFNDVSPDSTKFCCFDLFQSAKNSCLFLLTRCRESNPILLDGRHRMPDGTGGRGKSLRLMNGKKARKSLKHSD